MCIKQTLVIGIAAASLLTLEAPAQTSPDLFRLTFRATCRGLNTNGTRLVNTRLTETNIIAQCVGNNSGIALTNLNRFFALVYNTTADSIQVVNLTNGQPLCTVLDFSGVASTTDGRERLRLAYMFLPGQTNAFGVASIDERGIRTAAGVTNNFANIVGNAQFVLTGNTELGASNSLSAASSTNTTGMATNTSGGPLGNVNLTGITTNFFMTSAFDDPSARVCTALFFTGNRVPLTTPTVVTVTNLVTLTNTIFGTNLISLTNTITGTNLINLTNTIVRTNTIFITNTIPVTNTVPSTTVTNRTTGTNVSTGAIGTSGVTGAIGSTGASGGTL